MPAVHPLARDLDEILGRTTDVWDALRGQRLFLTGGTGFFGCWLLESLLYACDHLALDTAATVLTRSIARFTKRAPHLASHPAVTLLEGDVRSFSFPAGHFSYILHAATDSSRPSASAADLFDTIVSGTRRVLDLARHCRAHRLLLTSSGAVYGQQPADVARLDEGYGGSPNPADPGEAYAEGKRAAEMLCAAYAKDGGLEPVIARCFAFVGPYLPLDAHFAVANFIRDRLHCAPISVLGDGTVVRSYLYAADLVVWLWVILIRGTTMRPYNVGSPDGITIAELASVVAASQEPQVPVVMAGSPASSPRRRYVPDVSRAVTELGVRQEIALDEAIRRTLDWHQRLGLSATVGGRALDR
jgi:dTDP-glucose 4,6-dehydratase